MGFQNYDPSWYMDFKATSHMTNNVNNFLHLNLSTNNHIQVDNNHCIPITGYGYSSIANKTLAFRDVYLALQIIKINFRPNIYL